MANPRRRNILVLSLITGNCPWSHVSQMRNLPLGKPAGNPGQLSLLPGCNNSLWHEGLPYYSSSMSGTCTSFWQCGQKLVVFYVFLIHRERFAAIDASEIQQNVHVYKTPRWIFEWLPANRMACGLVSRPLVIRLISFSWPLYL